MQPGFLRATALAALTLLWPGWHYRYGEIACAASQQPGYRALAGVRTLRSASRGLQHAPQARGSGRDCTSVAQIPNSTPELAFAAASPHARPSALEGVIALDKPVTYSETKIPLSELLQKIADDTGVPLTAAHDVSDEPVAVVVKEMPARRLLEQLAELLDYQWIRLCAHPSPNAPRRTPTFEIDQDLASKQRETALRPAQMEAVQKRLQERLASYLQLARGTPARSAHYPARTVQRKTTRSVLANWVEFGYNSASTT